MLNHSHTLESHRSNSSSKSHGLQYKKTILTNFRKKVLPRLLAPLEKDNYKFSSDDQRRELFMQFLYRHITFFEFNFYQVVLTICYADVILTNWSQSRLITSGVLFSSFIIALISVLKMTTDWEYKSKDLGRYFEIKDIGKLESQVLKMIDYRLCLSRSRVEKYLVLLLDD